MASGDNGGKLFAVIDKPTATISLFDRVGTLMAKSPVLLGKAFGDESVAGIGDRPIESILENERTTPAGRFVSEAGSNLKGESIVWIDYEAAVSMHRLRASKSNEKRAERLQSVTPLDNRITYGCVNIPVSFYEMWIVPTLGKTSGIIYVLPDTKPAKDVFHFLR